MGRFLLIEYDAWDDSGKMFDSTRGEIAKMVRGFEGPILVVLGVDSIIPGLKKILEEMKEGEEKEFKLNPSEAFGHKDAKLVKVFSIKQFEDNNLKPQVGDIIEVENEGQKLRGIVKNIGSGRVTVDFNHPLAGKVVYYKVKILKEIKEEGEKVKTLAERSLRGKGFKINKVEDDKVFIGVDERVVEAVKKDEKVKDALLGLLVTFFEIRNSLEFLLKEALGKTFSVVLELPKELKERIASAFKEEGVEVEEEGETIKLKDENLNRLLEGVCFV